MSNIGSMFKAPKPPPVTIVQQTPAPIAAPTPVAPLPTYDAEEVRQQRALTAANALSRGGRRSTILTTPGSRMGAGGAQGGGDPYASKAFGGT